MGRLEDVLARGTVTAADGSKKMRELQAQFLADEVRDELEHAEPYGFTSEPHADGREDAFALFFDGDRSHGIVFCVADRRYRIKPLKPGEVAVYDDLGQKVYLTRTGILIETPENLTAKVAKDVVVEVGQNVAAAVKGNLTAKVDGNAEIKAKAVKIDAPDTTITGRLTVQQQIIGQGGMAVSGGGGSTVQGGFDVTDGDVTADGISLKNHTHRGDSGGETGKAQ